MGRPPHSKSTLTPTAPALASHLMRHASEEAIVLAALAAVVLLASQPAGAGTVYHWTDERGVVHFADVPPQDTKQVKTESLPDTPPPLVVPAGAAAGAGPAGEATPGDADGEKGPARVVVTDHQAVAVGPAVQSFRGKVKNEGGAEAHDVAIAIVVSDPAQGDECLHDQIDVAPSTLPPGAEGTFEAQFDNPCFHGPTNTDLRAEWR